MSDLVGNPEDRFSQNEAHMKIQVARANIQENCLVTQVLELVNLKATNTINQLMAST